MTELETLHKLSDEMVATLQQTMRFNTEEMPSEPNAPFGKENAACLDYVLNKCRELGFTTYNCDYRAGHAEIGQGDEVFGILGHLDVVPAKEKTWKYNPYGAEIHDGVLYGRGALDDKGPMIACLYAVKALVDAGYSFKRKVRLIFGCNEETGMGDIPYYLSKMPAPDVAISPDGDFPIINREKGIIGFRVNCGKVNSNILNINAGIRRNIVPDECFAEIKKGADLSRLSKEIIVEQNGNTIVLTAKGVASHGATPDKGVNATWKIFQALNMLYPDDAAVKYAWEKMCDYTGKKWGVNLCDKESGELTANIGVVRVTDSQLIITVDVRHPVTYTNEQVIKLFERCSGIAKITVASASQPLFVPESSPLVQTLISAYTTATGTKGYTIAIGGGTYSRCISNCVAFGPEFPNEDAIIHQPNERIALSRLFELAKIYMQAIKQLCCK